MATLPDGWIDADEFARRRGLPPAKLGDLVAQHWLFSTLWNGKALYPAFSRTDRRHPQLGGCLPAARPTVGGKQVAVLS